MEGGKKSGSGSSFTTDLFGSKDSPVSSSSSGIFGSIFAPPGKASSGRESLLRQGVVERKLDSASQAWSTKTGPSGEGGQVKQGKNASNNQGKDAISYSQAGRVNQPCHLSSSIYYGGQEVYSQPQSTHNPNYPTFSNDAVEDETGATRGNWWQGSLYY